MRLLSLIVRNYRVHREVEIALDPARTLIGGPNESGKSTLVEAAHRALFLRAKTGGETQKSMASRLHAGHPEVEVCFEARGRSWRLVKRFSGANGTALLADLHGASWSGDEAETRLAEMLGAEATGGGDRARGQWAHLWIRQGCSADDPTEHATSQCAALLARLSGEGGAAVMQSECDTRIAREQAERHDALFTRAQAPKAGTELANAVAAEALAAAAQAAAEQALARLERAVADLREAEKASAAAEAALAQLRPERERAEAQLARVAALRCEEQAQAPAAAAAAERYETLAQADTHLRELRARRAKLADALAPREAETQRLAQEESGRREREAAEEEAWQQVSGKLRAARLRSECAAAHLQRIERAIVREQLGRRRAQAQTHRASLARLEAALAQTRDITPAKLKTLQNLESASAQAGAALEAMAAGVELLASDAPVRIGDRPLAVGGAHILTEEAEVSIGPAIRLRIRPGGGTSLAEARQHLRETRGKLQQELDCLGLATVADAADAAARRQDLEAEVKTARARLDSLGAETIEEEFAAAVNAAAAAEAEAQRRSSLVAGLAEPASLEEAQALARKSAEALAAAEAEEAGARAAREAAAKSARRAAEELAAHQQTLGEQRLGLSDLEAQARLLAEKHGDDAARALSLAALLAVRTDADRLLAATCASLAQLQPELLERDRTRLERALAQHGAAKTDAEQRRAVARNELHRDGASDPHAELALAEAKLRAAAEHRATAARKAGAVRLLHELFEAEQRALAVQFTAPLAAKISGYLKCLFGAGAHAEVALASGTFSSLKLIRPGEGAGAFDFAALSGGTCEQLAAAVRLAMAEVLAPAHDGCLPLVFDDSFTNSDPERVQALQRMLDHAAARGLQVIVLTCNPADYAALGARQVSLRAAPDR